METLDRSGIDALLTALRERGFTVLGPTVRDRAIVYDELRSTADLPVGVTDEQAAGSYRLTHRGDDALFGYTVGPHSWKRWLHPPLVRLLRITPEEGGQGFTADSSDPGARRWAFVGVRACELAAIGIQDRVFLDGPAVDPVYDARRRGVFVVAVNCAQAGGTCFCASMDAGPRAREGFDLALTEVVDDDRHYFLVEDGSPEGREVLAALPSRLATADEVKTADRILESAASSMGRSLEMDGLPEILGRGYDSPRWEKVATRCLSCTNCTMVCPTCFCSTVEDVNDLADGAAERWRRWDSCFTTEFSYLHGGSVRTSVSSRYRQWLTHKLGTWIEQFGSPGCVGCGRCITWCPVGIDLTEEAAALRESDRALHA